MPHIICKGFSKEETEYALLDLNFLGIDNLFVVRGDSKPDDPDWSDAGTYNIHASDLQKQINDFNDGRGLDDMHIEGIETPLQLWHGLLSRETRGSSKHRFGHL